MFEDQLTYSHKLWKEYMKDLNRVTEAEKYQDTFSRPSRRRWGAWQCLCSQHSGGCCYHSPGNGELSWEKENGLAGIVKWIVKGFLFFQAWLCQDVKVLRERKLAETFFWFCIRVAWSWKKPVYRTTSCLWTDKTILMRLLKNITEFTSLCSAFC